MAMGERVLIPVLLYLFHRVDQRLDGRPTLILLDEAWVMLMNRLFGAKIEEWLRSLRKKNAAVVLATQSLTEIGNSPYRDVILESCPTKVFLPIRRRGIQIPPNSTVSSALVRARSKSSRKPCPSGTIITSRRSAGAFSSCLWSLSPSPWLARVLRKISCGRDG
jgi:hypothetical protein